MRLGSVRDSRRLNSRHPHYMAEPQSVPIGNPSWERVQLARHPKRPHALDYIQRLFTNFYEIHGDRAFSDDHATMKGLILLAKQAIDRRRGRYHLSLAGISFKV